MAARRVLVLGAGIVVAVVLCSCDLFKQPDVDVDLEGAIGIVLYDVLPDSVPLAWRSVRSNGHGTSSGSVIEDAQADNPQPLYPGASLPASPSCSFE
jgi:hypothetical protein